MKVLILAPGNSLHSQRLIELLLGQGCHVVCVDERNPLQQTAPNYEFIPMPRLRGFRFQWSRRHLTARLAGRELRKIWERVRPDVVNVHFVDIRAEACAKANLHPLVLSCWGTDINQFFQSESPDLQARARIGAALAGADCVTGGNPEILDRCQTLAGRPLRTEFFQFGIDIHRFQHTAPAAGLALRRELGIAPEAKVFLSIRPVSVIMGQDQILEAFARIAPEKDLPPSVLVFKKHDPIPREYLARLQARTKELGLESRIWFIEQAAYEQMPAQYAMADVILNYAKMDGFPVSFFEAAASHRPVITNRLSIYENVFRDTFVMVPSNDPVALAAAMRDSLLENPAGARRRVEAAYAIACEVGDQEKCILSLIDLYRRLADGTKRHSGSPR